MAITATYKDASIDLPNATLKISKLWGSKVENWNAWVDVLRNPEDLAPSATFSISTAYVEGENPYVLLYSALGKLSFLSNVVSDDKNHVEVVKEVVEEKVEPVVEEKKTPTKRTKKEK